MFIKLYCIILYIIMGNEVSSHSSSNELFSRQIAGIIAVDTEAPNFTEELIQAGGIKAEKWVITVGKNFETSDGRIGTVVRKREGSEIPEHIKKFFKNSVWEVKFERDGNIETMYPGFDMHEPKEEIRERHRNQKVKLDAEQALAKKLAAERQARESALKSEELNKRHEQQRIVAEQRAKEKYEQRLRKQEEKKRREEELAERQKREKEELERKQEEQKREREEKAERAKEEAERRRQTEEREKAEASERKRETEERERAAKAERAKQEEERRREDARKRKELEERERALKAESGE